MKFITRARVRDIKPKSSKNICLFHYISLPLHPENIGNELYNIKDSDKYE